MIKENGQAPYRIFEEDLDHVIGGVDWPIGYGPGDGTNGGCEEEPPVRL